MENSNNVDIQKFNNIRKKFILNILFGQKLINNLSREKKKEAGIDYFLMHLRNLKLQREVDWNEKINVDRLTPSLITDVQNNLQSNIRYSFFSNQKYIEPYILKPIKFLSDKHVFNKVFFSHTMVNLESKFYNFICLIYDSNENIKGYILIGKKSSGEKKNIYIVLDDDYSSGFYNHTKKNVVIISDISEDLHFFEKNVYNDYLKNYRNFLFTVVTDCLTNNKDIKNIVCIGNQRGGNILQLFVKDFILNKNYIGHTVNKEETIFERINEKKNSEIISKDINVYLFEYDTAMLSNKTFYDSLLEKMGEDEKTFINCFYNKNKAYNSWDKMNKDSKLNTIILF